MEDQNICVAPNKRFLHGKGHVFHDGLTGQYDFGSINDGILSRGHTHFQYGRKEQILRRSPRRSFLHKNQIVESKLLNFKDLIKHRLVYLERLLDDFPEDWISTSPLRDKPVNPSEMSIERAKKLLSEIWQFHSLNLNWQPPKKLLLGPRTVGGIAVDVIYDEMNSFTIKIDNHGHSEVEIMTSGSYIGEENLDSSQAINFIFSKFV